MYIKTKSFFFYQDDLFEAPDEFIHNFPHMRDQNKNPEGA